MTHRLTTAIVVIAFVTLAVFGLYVPGHVGHGMDCPFSVGESAICASTFSHLEHWQSAFTAVLVQFLVLIGAAFVVWRWFQFKLEISPQFERYRVRQRIPLRPPVLQELYSQGILNRKEP